jgi:hypothetical protein
MVLYVLEQGYSSLGNVITPNLPQFLIQALPVIFF